MAWATEAEVLALTGRTVTADQVAQAQAIIELFAETTPEADADQAAKTLRLLNRAVSWQAAWMATQIDVDARVDVQTLSQDGVSTQFADEDAQYLAPLAKRCLNKLPWRRSRSVFTGNRPGDRYNGIQAARDNVVYERDDERDGQQWIPLYS
jgi:hypothetical protein